MLNCLNLVKSATPNSKTKIGYLIRAVIPNFKLFKKIKQNMTHRNRN